MASAHDIANGGVIPNDWDWAQSEIGDHVKQAYVQAENLRDQPVQAIRYARDDDGNVVLGEDETPELVALTDEGGHAVMEPHPLVHRLDNFGLHAYRYEQLDDGSVVAVYSNDPTGTVKMKAFDSIEEASLWSPRDERTVAEAS